MNSAYVQIVVLALTVIIAYTISKSKQSNCALSLTTATGSHAPKGQICSGDLIFEENFDSFDLSKWQHEQTLAGGKNWEFQWYTNNRSVSYVENGVLHIKPHLLTEYMGDSNFVYEGHIDLAGGTPADECTNPSYYGCSRRGNRDELLNPVVSASIRTVHSFSYKFGRLEVRARIPAGDWLWPAIWLLPKFNQYSSWPSSGEINVMESRGNQQLIQNNRNIGTQLVGSTIHWGTNPNFHKYLHSEKSIPEGFDKDYHKYQFEWTPDYISFSVDDQMIGLVEPPSRGFWELGGFSNLDNPWKEASKMAPFDQEFYIILNVACGSVFYFPDDAENPGGKPWKNNSPYSIKEFWEARHQWLPTWHRDTDSYHFMIDYVKVWAL